jgi:hypothetical protein
MAPDRRKHLLLAVLTVVLAGAVYRAWSLSNRESNAPARRPAGTESRGGRGTDRTATTDVHLKDLGAKRPQPLEGVRNLFRFKPKPQPAPASVKRGEAVLSPVPAGPPPPPPPPPITLKFIGVVERPEKSEKIAVLRDATGHLMSGREGAVIEGRFRILRIGVESIEMAYLDGRGRQTIRLSGG